MRSRVLFRKLEQASNLASVLILTTHELPRKITAIQKRSPALAMNARKLQATLMTPSAKNVQNAISMRLSYASQG